MSGHTVLRSFLAGLKTITVTQLDSVHYLKKVVSWCHVGSQRKGPSLLGTVTGDGGFHWEFQIGLVNGLVN